MLVTRTNVLVAGLAAASIALAGCAPTGGGDKSGTASAGGGTSSGGSTGGSSGGSTGGSSGGSTGGSSGGSTGGSSGSTVTPLPLPSGPVGGPLALGADVSKYEGTVDWAQVAAAGHGFGIARVS